MEITITINIEDELVNSELHKYEGINDVEFSQYARIFDCGCQEWCKDLDYNIRYLKYLENCATDILKAKGYLFLNDVYKMLGLAPTKIGQVVGWIYDEKNPIGDNRVDFGTFKILNECDILLDFNVDGCILDRL